MVLVGLLAIKLTQLVRDWRGHVIGSRLKARMVWIFGVLATLPILLVYFFAVQFLNKGIDSWFNVEIRKSLDDALVLIALGARSAHARAPRRHRQLIADEIARTAGPMPGVLEIAAAAGRRARTHGGDRSRCRASRSSKGLSSDVVPGRACRTKCCCRCGRAGRS